LSYGCMFKVHQRLILADCDEKARIVVRFFMLADK